MKRGTHLNLGNFLDVLPIIVMILFLIGLGKGNNAIIHGNFIKTAWFDRTLSTDLY